MSEAKPKATGSEVLEEVFQNVRKAAETSLKLQQEILAQFSSLWPAVPTPQSAVVSRMQQLRSKWIETVSGLARKHREVIDRQYDAALESLDAALAVSDAGTPEELRRRSEQFCRKTLDCVREVAETQVQELQNAVSKWTDLVAKVGP
ncbi:MAG: hypothetical protein DCC67_01600 [Planctomycetota bacterium]|nr:MAG: hypothetical protein DCC67_01600 [Planctomycetota bacterium]